MLANGVVLPVYASPITWWIAAIAMLLEIGVVEKLLRRAGQDRKGLTGALVLIQLLTWIPFLRAADEVLRRFENPWLWVVGLEVVVVLIEAPMLAVAVRGWLFRRHPTSGTISWKQAFVASFLGNLTSVAVSVGAPVAAITVGRHLGT